MLRLITLHNKQRENVSLETTDKIAISCDFAGVTYIEKSCHVNGGDREGGGGVTYIEKSCQCTGTSARNL